MVPFRRLLVHRGTILATKTYQLNSGQRLDLWKRNLYETCAARSDEGILNINHATTRLGWLHLTHSLNMTRYKYVAHGCYPWKTNPLRCIRTSLQFLHASRLQSNQSPSRPGTPPIFLLPLDLKGFCQYEQEIK